MTRITDFIFVYGPYPKINKGSFSSNVVVVKGQSKQFMIDTGTMSRKSNNYRLRGMNEDGVQIKDFTDIFITHFHPDHHRGTPFWDRIIAKTGKKDPIPYHLHPFSHRYALTPDLYGDETIAMFGDMYSTVVSIPPKMSKRITNWLWGRDPKIDEERLMKINNHQEYKLDDGLTMKAIYTPGHAPDHVAFLVIKNGDPKKYLISGDLISLKDMGDGKGLVGLASFNNPLASLKHELESLTIIKEMNIDVLITMHYGIYNDPELISRFFSQAIEEGKMLWEKTQKILMKKQRIKFKELTKLVIDFPKYLSGISARTNSMWVILKELSEEGLVDRIPGTTEFRWIGDDIKPISI